MEFSVTVVGIGPGSPEYLAPAGKREIEKAKVLVGSQRALATFGSGNAEMYVIDKDIGSVLDFIAGKLANTDVVVMVSGDPGFYSLLTALRKRFSADRIRVIPGISSVQMAFARISEPWQGADFISMHGRQASDKALQYCPGKKLGILTDQNNTPATIAALLLAGGWPQEARAWLCANLSYADEEVQVFNLGEVTTIKGFEQCVMVVIA
ncbi:MAG: precorrin-6y C5,15-methyltransferase (decarboxylating) subunit CbiE [Negativicutes bacterium]|nr:precorrin-6y C5,15-methyltransferase (decarboxylating) subunit CbiE [Negativicutes bacterium]